MKKILKITASLSMALLGVVAMGSCSKAESYSNLLRDEEKATNWYLSNCKVETSIPEDEKFEIGPDAPFYRMDEDGYVYMQVLDAGDPDNMAQEGDQVYFRFMRTNLKNLWQGLDSAPEGNAGDLNSSLGPTSFIFGNYYVESSEAYGSGIQIPLKYLGYGCEVNLVLRSYYGFSVDSSVCIPYLINLKYFKAQY